VEWSLNRRCTQGQLLVPGPALLFNGVHVFASSPVWGQGGGRVCCGGNHRLAGVLFWFSSTTRLLTHNCTQGWLLVPGPDLLWNCVYVFASCRVWGQEVDILLCGSVCMRVQGAGNHLRCFHLRQIRPEGASLVAAGLWPHLLSMLLMCLTGTTYGTEELSVLL
jgi:hypothetical protein